MCTISVCRILFSFHNRYVFYAKQCCWPMPLRPLLLTIQSGFTDYDSPFKKKGTLQVVSVQVCTASEAKVTLSLTARANGKKQLKTNVLHFTKKKKLKGVAL